jgi:hypothetical protein
MKKFELDPNEVPLDLLEIVLNPMLAPIPIFSTKNIPAVGATESDVVEILFPDLKLKSKFPPSINAP